MKKVLSKYAIKKKIAKCEYDKKLLEIDLEKVTEKKPEKKIGFNTK